MNITILVVDFGGHLIRTEPSYQAPEPFGVRDRNDLLRKGLL
jgi:hypothetical protein